MSARTRYDYLASDRSQFLEEARQASELTLPYLIRGHEEYTMGMKQLKTPYQSVGAKGCVTLASLASGGLMNCTGGDPAEGWTAVNLAMAPFLALAGGAMIWLIMRVRQPA